MKNSCKIIIGITLLIFSACNANQTDKSAEASSPEKPLNIVYIMADDHAYQAISAYGSAVSKLAPTQILIESPIKEQEWMQYFAPTQFAVQVDHQYSPENFLKSMDFIKM